jgi:RNA polymerase sigma factor for flagellar operon FliA
MFDRPSYSPLLASAAVEGSIAIRPAARLMSESHRSSSVLEPLVKRESPDHGRADGDGPPGDHDPLPKRPSEADPLENASEAELEAAATEMIAKADAAASAADAAASAAETAPAEAVPAETAPAETAPPAESSAATEAAAEGTAAPQAGDESDEERDLSGYGVYGGGAATAALGMSREELVARYAHLVKYVVGRLGVSVPGLFDHEDAMQAGVVGLLRAIDAYRPESAASFESYAILRIRGSILDAVRSLDTVGRAGREAARAIQGAIRDLQHELGRSPSETEIAARLGIPVTRYRERLQAASVVTVSLDEHDARDEDDESSVLAESAADPNAVDPAEEVARRDAIASLVHEIGRLSQRSRMVLGLYYQDEMTFKEIGQVLGVTESRVCQIHTEAILALRTRLVDADVLARLGRRRSRL